MLGVGELARCAGATALGADVADLDRVAGEVAELSAPATRAGAGKGGGAESLALAAHAFRKDGEGLELDRLATGGVAG